MALMLARFKHSRFGSKIFSLGFIRSEHEHNLILSNVLTLCMDIRGIAKGNEKDEQNEKTEIIENTIAKWQQLQVG